MRPMVLSPIGISMPFWVRSTSMPFMTRMSPRTFRQKATPPGSRWSTSSWVPWPFCTTTSSLTAGASSSNCTRTTRSLTVSDGACHLMLTPLPRFGLFHAVDNFFQALILDAAAGAVVFQVQFAFGFVGPIGAKRSWPGSVSVLGQLGLQESPG